MKKIFILGGGTATAWHLCNIIKRDFLDCFYLYIGDINERKFIPSSLLCDRYIQLQYTTNHSFYYSYMLEVLKNEKIDFLIPLIDNDLFLFSNDNPDLLKLNVQSTSPCGKTMNICMTKKNISIFLTEHGLLVPRHYKKEEIETEKVYFVKPNKGFGSKDARTEKGKDISYSDDIIIQEVLHKPEITVEIFKKNDYYNFIIRERIETKSGVSTKARFIIDSEIVTIINRINNIFDLPLVSCVQFMKNEEEKWYLTDLNMRLGAGTALSTAAGFSIASAFISVLAGRGDFKKYLKDVPMNLIVTRVYNELVMP